MKAQLIRRGQVLEPDRHKLLAPHKPSAALVATRDRSRRLHRSNLALLRRCVRALEPTPDYVLTDGFPVSKMPCPSLGVKKGDMVTASIAAASIVAKVTRDRIMRGLHRRYPEFDFAHNKGYGTPVHRAVLRSLGPTPIHRLSFAGVGQPELPGLDGAAPEWP